VREASSLILLFRELKRQRKHRSGVKSTGFHHHH